MPQHDEPHRRIRSGRTRHALIGVGLLALGGITGAAVMAQTRPAVSMVAATPVAIHALPSVGIVTIRGHVAEIYGNSFVMEDGTGRALVDTGPRGDKRHLVTASEAVTVQGRFDRGIMHAAFLVGSDGSILPLGPLAGPPHDWHDKPDQRPYAPPPPAPAMSGTPAAPLPAAD